MVIFTITTLGSKKVLTALINGVPKVATNEHPLWEEIVARCKVSDDTVLELFDVEHVANVEFSRISERVTVNNGQVYFDGDPFSLDMSNKIIDFVKTGSDFEPLVKFLDKIMQNPSIHSREQAIEWLARYNWGLAEDGDIIGYKGVYDTSGDPRGNYRSGTSGANEVTVDNKVSTGYVYQSIGSTVEMARSLVEQDPYNSCGRGLHVTSFDYAQQWGNKILAVKFNPRDLVSVPFHDNFVKVRVCRYFIMEEVSLPVEYTTALPKVELYAGKHKGSDEPKPVPEPKTWASGGIIPSPGAWTVSTASSTYTPPMPVGSDDVEDEEDYDWCFECDSVWCDCY